MKERPHRLSSNTNTMLLIHKTQEQRVGRRIEPRGQGIRLVQPSRAPDFIIDDRAAAGRDHHGASLECVAQDAALNQPKRGLSGTSKYLRNRSPLNVLDLRVGVNQRPAKRLGEHRSDGALPRPAQSDQHDSLDHVYCQPPNHAVAASIKAEIGVYLRISE